jgi:hypothetical protein
MKRAVLASALVLATTIIASPAVASPWLDEVKDATRDFKSVATAEAAGYGEFKDAAGIACIEHHHDGGMGVHYVNGKRVGDAKIGLHKPEALVYEPRPGGGLRLAALEYIVFKKAWRGEHPTGKPRLQGQVFTLVPAGNRYGIPAFYELHLWAWKDNPAGLFADYNPEVSCPTA